MIITENFPSKGRSQAKSQAKTLRSRSQSVRDTSTWLAEGEWTAEIFSSDAHIFNAANEGAYYRSAMTLEWNEIQKP